MNIKLGKQTINDRFYEYSFNPFEQNFSIIERSNTSGDEVFNMTLDANAQIIRLIFSEPNKTLDLIGFDLEEHKEFVLGREILVIETENTNFSSMTYNTSKYFYYEETELIRIYFFKEKFDFYKNNSTFVSHEFQSKEELDLDLSIEKQILEKIN